MDDNNKRQEGINSMWEEVEKPHEPLPPPKTPEEKWAELIISFLTSTAIPKGLHSMFPAPAA